VPDQNSIKAARSCSEHVPVGNIEVNNPVTAAFQATFKALKAAKPSAGFQGRRRPNNIGVDVGADITAPDRAVDREPQGRGRTFRTKWRRDAAIGTVRSSSSTTRSWPYGFDLGPKQLEQIKTGRCRALRTTALPAGLLPGHAALSSVDRNIPAAIWIHARSL